MGFFERVFDGNDPIEEVIAYLKGEEFIASNGTRYPQTTLERITWKNPYPLIRHHFGLPTMEETIKGVEKISNARCLDVISLGIDQDAQENFYHPERQNPRRKGAGGVPVRNAEDYQELISSQPNRKFSFDAYIFRDG